MSAVIALAKPRRIKASHRRRRRVASDHLLYILNNPLSGTDPSGYCVTTGTHIKGESAPSCGSTGARVDGPMEFATDKKSGRQTPDGASSSNASNGAQPAQKATAGADGRNPEGATSASNIGSSDEKNTLETISVVAPKLPDIVGTPDTDSIFLRISSSWSSTEKNEQIVLVGTDGRTQQNTGGNDQASIDIPADRSKIRLFGHGHNFVPDDGTGGSDGVAKLMTAFRRMLPTSYRDDGRNDTDAVLISGKPNYVRGTDGVARVVERVGNNWRVRTVTPNVPNAFGQSNWSPGRPIELSPRQRSAIKFYQQGKIGFERALEMGGISSE